MDNFVVGIGEVLWDVLPDGRKAGGAPSNFAYHVSQFGLPGRVVSAVGQDSLGEELLSVLRDKGLESVISTVPYPTGTVQVTLDKDGIPRYDIKEGSAWDNIPYTPELEDLAKHTGAVCFGSLAQRSTVSANTIGRFIDHVPANCLKIFDINLRQNYYSEKVVSASLQKCNILKINDEELEVVSRMYFLSGTSMQEKCAGLMSSFGLRALILTCGASGSYVLPQPSRPVCFPVWIWGRPISSPSRHRHSCAHRKGQCRNFLKGSYVCAASRPPVTWR